MKKLSILTLLFGLTLSSITGMAAVSSTPALRIEVIKKEILRISKKATSQMKRQNEFRLETRRALDPLVSELAKISPPKNVSQQVMESVGAWKSVWSDLPYTTAIAAQIYQVVFPGGYYYNVSRYESGREVYTSYLRGVYELRESDLEINFTKAVKNAGFPKRDEDLYRLAMRAELGEFDQNIDEENARGVGRRGNLVTYYVDKDIRVIGGGTEDGTVPGSLFILEPVNSIR